MVEHDEKIKAHFNSELADYDFCADKVVPRNLELQQAMVAAIPFYNRARLRMLDLGVGTGQTSTMVLQAFPNARVDGIDLSSKMLDVARRRLERYGSRVSLKQSDFCVTDFGGLGEAGGANGAGRADGAGAFDVVFSAVSIHNCLDDDKRVLFKKIGAALRPGGCFVNADFVKFASPTLQSSVRSSYSDFLKRNLAGKELEHWTRHVEREDKPAVIEEQFAWLRENGFGKIETPYSFENTVVYRAMKA